MVDEDRQCTATANSTGERCKRAAIKGSNVCYVHGGAASQVKEKAQERLDRMADTTTGNIQENIEDLQKQYERADDPEVKVKLLGEIRKLWKIILDRTGHGPTEKRELTGEDGGSIEVNISNERVD